MYMKINAVPLNASENMAQVTKFFDRQTNEFKCSLHKNAPDNNMLKIKKIQYLFVYVIQNEIQFLAVYKYLHSKLH